MIDSTVVTKQHIARVDHWIRAFLEILAERNKMGDFFPLVEKELLKRAKNHDKSKLMDPEKRIFDIYSPKLKSCTYGSAEYKGYLKEMELGLKHHYKANRHHPEHFKKGIEEMNVFDIVEMFCDWKAAVERHEDGDIYKSIDINAERFEMPGDLTKRFKYTAQEFDGTESGFDEMKITLWDYLENAKALIKWSLDGI